MTWSIPLSSSALNDFIRYGLVVALFSTTSCAGVSFIPLTEDGQRDWNSQEGLVYYRPVPYLLVVALPTPATAVTPLPRPQKPAQKVKRQPPPRRPMAAPAAGGSPDAGKGGQKGAGQDENGAGAAGDQSKDTPTDTGFSATNEKYSVKIIYLPDYSHPYAVSMSTGLFGTVSAKPQLQDGWMLTGLDSTADSKTSETITAFGTLLSAAAGASPAGAAARRAAAQFKPNVAAQLPAAAQVQAQTARDMGADIAAPGLYKFCYQKRLGGRATSGLIVGLQQVAVFSNEGALKPASPSEPDCATP